MDQVEGVYTKIREDGETLPLFVLPKDGNNSALYLKEWMKSHKPWLKKKLLEHGEPTFVDTVSMVRSYILLIQFFIGVD